MKYCFKNFPEFHEIFETFKQKILTHISSYYAGTAAALLTFVILVERFCVETFVERRLPWNNAYLQDLFDYVTVSITLLVVAVPEGLPLAVILTLAYSINVVSQSATSTLRSTLLLRPAFFSRLSTLSGLMNCGASRSRSSTVSPRASCAGALSSCWKTKIFPAMLPITGSSNTSR